MSANNGFKVIDRPEVGGFGGGKWAELAIALKRLPKGKAIEVDFKVKGKNRTSNLHTQLGRYGLRVGTSRISEHKYAVWVKSPAGAQ